MTCGYVKLIIGNVWGHLSAGGAAENKHRKHRANRAKSNKAEGVFAGVLTADAGGNANAESHYEGNGDRTCCYSARIECERNKRVSSHNDEERCKHEEDHVREHQERGDGLVSYDLDDANHKEESNANANGEDKSRAVHNVRHLICKHRKVGLGNGDKYSHGKRHYKQNGELFKSCKTRADVLTHRGHGNVCAKIKKTYSKNQKYGRDQKSCDFCGRKVN